MSKQLEAYREAFECDIPDDTVERRWLVAQSGGSVTEGNCIGILTWVPKSHWCVALNLPIGGAVRFGDRTFVRLLNAE